MNPDVRIAVLGACMILLDELIDEPNFDENFLDGEDLRISLLVGKGLPREARLATQQEILAAVDRVRRIAAGLPVEWP